VWVYVWMRFVLWGGGGWDEGFANDLEGKGVRKK
jgi:hypothetical protein